MENNNIPNKTAPTSGQPVTPKPINPAPINNAPVNPVPVIPESELKLPQENFGDTAPAPEEKSGIWTVLLLVLLVLLLGVLTVVVIWGEEIIDMVMPAAELGGADMEDTTPAPTPEPTPEEDMAAMETELENIDFAAMDAELNAIEAELDAEASNTATTTP